MGYGVGGGGPVGYGSQISMQQLGGMVAQGMQTAAGYQVYPQQ